MNCRHRKTSPGKKRVKRTSQKDRQDWMLFLRVDNDVVCDGQPLRANSEGHALKIARDKLQVVFLERRCGSLERLTNVFLVNHKAAFKLNPSCCGREPASIRNPRHLWKKISIDEVPSA